MTRLAATEELDTIRNATTPTEMMAAMEKVVAAVGRRMPTMQEVVAGYTAMLHLTGMNVEERKAMTILAGRLTREVMAKNDSAATEGTSH